MKRAITVSIAIILICSAASFAQTKATRAKSIAKPAAKPTAPVKSNAPVRPDLSKQPTLYVVPYAHLDTQWREFVARESRIDLEEPGLSKPSASSSSCTIPVSRMKYIFAPSSVSRSARQSITPSSSGMTQSEITSCGFTSIASFNASRPFTAAQTL